MKNITLKILLILNFLFLVIILLITFSNTQEIKNIKRGLELVMNEQPITVPESTVKIDTSWTRENDPEYLKDETAFVLSTLDNKEGLTANDKILLTGRAQDEYGFTHKRYQHYYKSVVVNGSEYLIHEKNGEITSTGGTIIRLPEINVFPVISEAEALLKAKQYLKIKDEVITPGQLIISPIGNNFSDGPFVLCWSFSNLGNYQIYINAIDGTEVNRISNIVF